MSAFPPHRSTEALPISIGNAQQFLSAYLAASKTYPHLLPNARLEPSGPTAGSSNSSVIIHNLQRVEAGLRGEWLAPTLELDEGVKVTKGMDDGTNTGEAATETEGEGWMDLDQYQREQSIEGGEVGSPGAVVIAQEGDSDLEDNRARGGDDESGIANEKDGEDEADAPAPKKVKTKHQAASTKATFSKPKDVLARKADKKARRKEEQRRKAEAQQAAAAAN